MHYQFAPFEISVLDPRRGMVGVQVQQLSALGQFLILTHCHLPSPEAYSSDFWSSVMTGASPS